MQRQTYCAALAAVALLGTATAMPAQVCAGLPEESVGSASYGVEGTDGASGQSFALSARHGRTGLRISYSRLDMFARSDDMATWKGELAWAPGEGATWACVLAGAEWTGYSADQHASTSWDTESNRRTEEHVIVGDYDRVRFPVGFSVGRELAQGGAFSAVPFASAALVVEHETLARASSASRAGGPEESRTRLAPVVQGGVTLRFHRLLLRSTLGHVFTGDDALSGRNNFPVASLSLGLAF